RISLLPCLLPLCVGRGCFTPPRDRRTQRPPYISYWGVAPNSSRSLAGPRPRHSRELTRFARWPSFSSRPALTRSVRLPSTFRASCYGGQPSRSLPTVGHAFVGSVSE